MFSIHSNYSLNKSDPVRYLGKVSSCTIDAKQTIMQAEKIDEISPKVTERISYLQNFMDDNELLGDFEREMIEERIGKLTGGICIVKAGGL